MCDEISHVLAKQSPYRQAVHGKVEDIRMEEMMHKRYASMIMVQEDRATEKQLHGHQDSYYCYSDTIAFHTCLLSVHF